MRAGTQVLFLQPVLSFIRQLAHDPWGDDKSQSLDDQLKELRKLFAGLFGTGGGGGGRGRRSGGAPFGLHINKGYYLLAVLAAVLVWAVAGIYTVDAQEQAVVLRLGKFHAVKEPGLNWRMLFIDDKTQVNVTRVREYEIEKTMLTRDQNIVKVPVTIQYVVSDAKSYVTQVSSPVQILEKATESALRHVVGGNAMDTVLSVGRDIIAAEVHARLQSYLDTYSSGLEVVKVNILRGNPPEQVQGAFVDVVKSHEDRTRMRNQAEAYARRIIPEARGEARRLLEEAEGYKQSVIARAKGDASRFTQLYEEYRHAPEVTKRRLYTEALQSVLAGSRKVLVDVQGNNNVLYLPIPGAGGASATAGQDTAQVARRDAEFASLLEQLQQEVSRLRGRGSDLVGRGR